MATTHVSPEQLSHMAGEIRGLARSFESTRPPALQGCGLTGRAEVERAYEEFSRHWARFVGQCSDEVATMSQLIVLAAEAYQKQDGKVAQAAAESAAAKVGGR
ncbi:MAG: hypothetical protein JHD16_01160 [Solirubrobacteraceae bacterium]|nr:hypothetical protein [Solirubrobacteraceae bacterium]